MFIPNYTFKDGEFHLFDSSTPQPELRSSMEAVAVLFETDGYRILAHGDPNDVWQYFHALRTLPDNHLFYYEADQWELGTLNTMIGNPGIAKNYHDYVLETAAHEGLPTDRNHYEMSKGTLTAGIDPRDEVIGEGANLYDVTVTRNATASRTFRVRADSPTDAEETAETTAVAEQCAFFEMSESGYVRHSDVCADDAELIEAGACDSEELDETDSPR